MALTTELARPFPASEVLSLDIETTGLDPKRDQMVVIAVSDGDGAVTVDVRSGLTPALVVVWLAALSPDDWLVVLDYLCQQRVAVQRWLVEHVFDRHVVVHNGMFDFLWLLDWYECGIPARIHDTMLTEQLLTAGLDRSASLEAVVARRLGVVLDKQWQTSFTITGEIAPEQIAYVEEDVRHLRQIAREQMIEIRAQQLDTVYEIEHGALPVFVQMVRDGVRVDRERISALIDLERDRMRHLEAELIAILTQHVIWQRVAKRDAMQAEFDRWERRRAAEEQRLTDEWDAATLDWRLWLADYDGAKKDIPQHANRFFDADWMREKFYDPTINRKDGRPEGLRRYLRRGLQRWRAQEGNERPASPITTVDEPINLNAPQQVWAAFHHLGVTVSDPKGEPTMRSKAVKAALAKATDEEAKRVLQMYLDFKKSAKLVQAFGEKLIARLDEDDILHGGFRQIGTATGRPSSNSPNMLQMPKLDAFRRCFRAEPGHLFVVADYSQMELRIMAQMSGDWVLTNAFLEGEDLHALTAAGIYGVPMDQVTEAQRGAGKVANFGILYGLTPMGVMTNMAGNGVFMDEEQSEAVVSGWHATYPGASAQIERWGTEGVKNGFTATALGRRRFFDLPKNAPRWMENGVRRRAANHPIQGGNADIMKLAMAVVQEQVRPLGGSVRLQVYDELVVSVPAEHARAAQVIVKAAMLAAAKLVLTDVPVAVDCVISPSWSEKEAREWLAAQYGRPVNALPVEEREVELFDEEDWEELIA